MTPPELPPSPIPLTAAGEDSNGQSAPLTVSTTEAGVNFPPLTTVRTKPVPFYFKEVDSGNPWLLLCSLLAMGLGLLFQIPWVGFCGALIALLLSLQVILPSIRDWVVRFLTPQEQRSLLGTIAFFAAIAGLAHYFGVYERIGQWLINFKYDEFGSWAEWVGALGQIMIAVLAVYVAWQQYVISKDLTIQQNRITQQQTIDTYFQGISDLVLDEEGMLED